MFAGHVDLSSLSAVLFLRYFASPQARATLETCHMHNSSAPIALLPVVPSLKSEKQSCYSE